MPGQSPGTDVSVCDNGYFRAMKVPLLRGRLFSEREMREKSNVVIVNDTLARRYFAGEDPLGKSLVIAMNDPNVPTEIIGVVGDVKFSGLGHGDQPDDVLAAPAAGLQRDDADGADHVAIRRRSRRCSNARFTPWTRISRSPTCAPWISGWPGRCRRRTSARRC